MIHGGQNKRAFCPPYQAESSAVGWVERSETHRKGYVLTCYFLLLCALRGSKWNITAGKGAYGVLLNHASSVTPNTGRTVSLRILDNTISNNHSG